MRVLIFAAIWTAIILFNVNGLQFHETIETNGMGDLYSTTNAEYAKDLVQASGDIVYTRMVNLDEETTNLSSKFKLSSAKTTANDNSLKIMSADESSITEDLSSLRSNRYMIAMKSPDGLFHEISINEASEIDSDSNITYENQQVTTNYDVLASGKLNERVYDGTHAIKNGDVLSIASTSLSGSGFTINSGLTEVVLMGSDTNILSDSVEMVEMSAEKSVQEPRTPLKNITDAAGIPSLNPGLPNAIQEDERLETKAAEPTSDVENVDQNVSGLLGNTTTPKIIGGNTSSTQMTSSQNKDIVSPGFVQLRECSNPSIICENYTHIFAIRGPGIGQPRMTPTLGAGYVTIRRPVEALQ